MSERVKRGATYEDVLEAPPDRIAEVSRGDLYLSPRPAPRHARAAIALGGELYESFDRGRSGPGGWWVLLEPEIHFDGNVLVPDIAAWRRSRLAALPEGSWFDLAPDWVCEIASPSTEQFDRSVKLPLYATDEVAFLWLVDPLARRLEVYRRDRGRWRVEATFAGAQIVSAEPFEAVAIELHRLWS